MGNISYKAEAAFVFFESGGTRRTFIQSFSVIGGSAKAVNLNSTNDTNLLQALDLAKSKKNITLFKAPSKDDFDTVMSGLFKKKEKFGINLDFYASYTGKSWIQFVHFLGEDASVSSQPSRIGSGRTLSLKLEFSFPKADYIHGYRKDGKWIDDDDWMR